MPQRHPVLRNILDRRMVELQLLMLGIPRDEIQSLSEDELERDLVLLKHIMDKRVQQNG